jgi:hypothetical protein
LLVAFIATVIASGGGGVVSPWLPHPATPPPDLAVRIADQARIVAVGPSVYHRRVE